MASDYHDALAYLMATPGARSDDPVFFTGGRRAGKSMAMKMLKERPVMRGNEPTAIWIDELGELDMAAKQEPVSQEVIDALNLLAGEMTAHFQANKEKVTLLSPGNLTVTVPGKGFSKANHIGGEEFIPERAYVGSSKAGSRLIFVFNPVAASAYASMEMTEAEAQTQLDGFRVVANYACGGDFVAELRAIRQLESKAREAATVQEKAKEYEDYGSW